MTKMQKFRIYPLDKYDVYAIERYNEAKDVYEVIGSSITLVLITQKLGKKTLMKNMKKN